MLVTFCSYVLCLLSSLYMVHIVYHKYQFNWYVYFPLLLLVFTFLKSTAQPFVLMLEDVASEVRISDHKIAFVPLYGCKQDNNRSIDLADVTTFKYSLPKDNKPPTNQYVPSLGTEQCTGPLSCSEVSKKCFIASSRTNTTPASVPSTPQSRTNVHVVAPVNVCSTHTLDERLLYA